MRAMIAATSSTAIMITATRGTVLPALRLRKIVGESAVVAPEGATFESPVPKRTLKDWPTFLKELREQGVERLYVLGGSELNGQLLGADLVDELFLTVAPKVRLGADLPTYAGGEALPREGLLEFDLIESHVVGDEVFLRYRRKKGEAA